MKLETDAEKHRDAIMLLGDLSPDTCIEDIPFSKRTLHGLEGEGIKVLSDLLDKNDRELLRTPNFGKVALFEVKLAMSKIVWPKEEDDENARTGMFIAWCLDNRKQLDRLRASGGLITT